MTSLHPKRKGVTSSFSRQAFPPESLSGFQGKGVAPRRSRRTDVAEIATKFDIHPHLIAQWKSQLLENAVSAFHGSSVKTEEVDVEKLHAKIGRLTLENNF